jgi:hypothetical protein
MKSVFSLIAKQQPKTFRVTYFPGYKALIPHHVVADPSHPLHESQKRRQEARKKEGLWWYATTGVDLNKSSCVRSWARRRLRFALLDALKQRGFDQNGKFVNLEAIKDRMDLMHVLRQGKTLDLMGSLRAHVQPPLISAKYTQVCAEMGHVIESMLQVIKNEAGGSSSLRKTTSRPQRDAPAAAQQSRVKPYQWKKRPV